MKLGEPTKFSSESGIGLAQEAGPVGTLESVLYRHMAEDMSAPAVFVADPGDGYRLLYASATCRHFGNSRETLHGMPLPEYIPTLTPARLKKLWQEVGKYRTTSMETDFCLVSGSRVAAEITFSLLEHDGRELMVGYMRDISERRVLEAERLRLAEEVAGQEAEFRYREIFENVTDGISLLDVVDGERFRYAGVNPALVRIGGILPAEMVGRFIEEVMPEDVARKMVVNYRRCMDAGKSIQYELTIDLPTGCKHLETTLVPVRNEFDRIYRIIGLTSDVTVRKEAEREIGFMNFSLDQMQDAVFLVDAQFRFRYVNDRACQSLGYSHDELLSMGVPDIDPGVDIPQLQALGAQTSARGHARFETLHRAKDGHVFPVEICATMFDYGGEIMSLAVVRDISERRQYEDILRKNRQFLTEAQRIAHVGSWELDLVENVLTWSDEVFRIFEIESGRFGASYEAFIATIHPDDRAAVNRAYTESLETRQPYEIEHRLLMADGRIKFVHERCETQYAEDGSPLRSLGTVQDVTERKLADQKMARLNSSLDHIRDTVLLIDEDARILYVNAGACHVLGYSREQLLSLRIKDIAPDCQLDGWPEQWRNLKAHGSLNFESRHKAADGRIYPVDIVANYVVFEGVDYNLAICRDISERRRMEAELASQAEFQQSLLNGIGAVGMQLMVIENGSVIHVGNRELARQFGYTDAELDAHPSLVDFIHPDDRARVMDLHRRRLAGEAVPDNYELGLVTHSGERREYEVAVTVVPGTNPVRVITIGRDITEQVRLREALAASEREFRTLAQNLPDVVVRYDSAGRFVYVNALFEQLLGVELDEIYGKTPTQAGLLEAEFFEELTRRVVQSGSRQEFEHPVLTADGVVIHGHIRVVPEFDADGQVQYVQIVTRDISERKRQEMLIQQQLEFERRVSYMADHIPGFLYTFRMPPEGASSFPYASAGIREVYGLQPEDVAEDMAPLHAMAHPDDRERIEAGLAAAAETLTPFHIECRINHPIKGERWLEFNSTPVLDVDGSMLFHGVVFDITERKCMEDVLRFIAQRGWHDNGESFLAGLARYLGHMLGMDYVIIDKLADDPANAETVALYAKGEVLPNMHYTLKATPCDNVMEGRLCCYPDNIQQLFPEDTLLVDMRAECYAGIPLLDSSGKVIGLIAVLDGKPMENTTFATSLLQMVATRAAAELEREQSERALAESRQFLKRIIDTIPDPVFVKDREHRWIHLNQACCEFIGHPPETLLGKSDYDFFPAHEADVFWAKDEAVFKSGGENVNEEEITDKDGNTHTIITKKVCYIDDRGQSILVGSIHDITERKRIEALLEAREQEFRSLAESSPNSIIRYDCEGRILYLNSALAGTLGVVDTEVIGKLPSEVWPDGRYDAIQQAAAQVLQTETEVRIELCAQTAGEPDFFQIRIVPERDVAGQVIGTIAFGVDITDLKRYTQSLLEQARLEQQLSGVAASVPGFIFTLRRETDGRNYFPFASAGVEELFGLRPEDIRDDAAVLRARYHPEDLPRVFALWGESEQSLSPFRIELRIFHPEHGMRWIEIRSTPQRQADGSTEWHGLMIDITERKQLQEAMCRDQSALAEAQRIANLGSWDWDVVSNRVEWSDIAYEIYTPDERPADPGFEEFKQSVHSDDLEMVVAAVAAAFEQDTPFDIEHRVVSRSKGVRTVHAQGKVFRDADGKPIRMVGTVQDITERKRLESDLISQADFQQTLLNAMYEVGLQLMMLENGRIIHIGNRKGALRLGLTEEYLAACPPMLDIVHPDDRARVMDYHKRRLAGEVVPTTYELGLVTRDGERREYETSVATVPGTDPVRVVSIGRDITERKRMEQALTMREREFRTLAENTLNIIARYDYECRRTYVNPAYERETGCLAENLTPEQIWVPTNITPQEYMATLLRILQTGVREDVLLEWPWPDGGLRSYIFTMTPERDASGRVTGVLAIGHNITELKRSEARLLQSEREFRTLVENLPTYVARLDKELRHVYANPAFIKSIGVPDAELLGAYASSYLRADNISADAYVALLMRVLHFGKPEDVPLEWTDDAGYLYSHLVRVVPEVDAGGETTGLLVMGFDITERRREQIMEAERQRVFELLSHGGELSEILNQVARYVEAAKPGWHCCVLLLDKQQNRLVSAASPRLSVPCSSSIDGVEVCEESGCCGATALRGERIVIEDISHHVCPKHCQDFAHANNLMACWSEPIVAPSGCVLGVVVIYLNHASAPEDEDRALLRHASHLSAIAIERKRIEQQMYHQASYDPLTGLPNRRLLGDRLREEIAKAERGGYRLAVLFIDLDRFKEVNDTLGHVAGDGLLVEAAQRIRACVRESDTVARLAGDEFIVILPEVGEIVPQNRVAQYIVESMARSFLLGEHNVYVSASVGIAVYPQDADNAETLISCADQAMYTAKETGRSSFSFFTCGMLELAQQRLQLASDLREALGNGQLEVYYQPIIDVVSGLPVKAEALLRWRHPQHGMVSPDMFIPLAEETGAIHEIGDWVFRQAAGVALQWQTLCAMGNDSPALCQISVNMSPRQFIRGNPDVAWIEHLQAIGLNPEAIVIEITEGLLLDDQSDVLNKLQCFHQAGIQLALDDFGTGYSAMAYLKKFNIDYLKIDRSFVRDLETDPGDRAIAEAIVAMAHRLGLKVIAEGVETEGQCAILTAAGCEYVQGYLHAKSMPTEVFLAYVVGQRLS